MEVRRYCAVVSLGLVAIWCASSSIELHAAGRSVHTFQRQQLEDVYYSEGASAGDINRDGHTDVVYGPFWYEGPELVEKHEIYTAKPQNRQRYADNFFSWIYDFNGDGWNDIFVVGFPGTPAYVYENPKEGYFKNAWVKHQVFDWVSNESPHFIDIVGDDKPELVCTRDGYFGFATIDWARPFSAWEFHPISLQIATKKFGHGLGVGDINGDDRPDILQANGWFEQPDSNVGSTRWRLHETSFSNSYGGAEMYAYDVDGDGDNDVITSHAAHDFGLAWYEQVDEDGRIDFRHHLIMGFRPEQNRYGVVFSELHSINLADMNGDGLKDIVTGKTYWSHHRKSPMWDAGAVVYLFRLARNDDGVDWVPIKVDDEAGIGRQVGVHDVNGDQLPDIVVGGMKGAHVLYNHSQTVDEARWHQLQPAPYVATEHRVDRGKPSEIDPQTGRVPGAIEGEAMRVVRVNSGDVQTQKMDPFRADRWSGDEQLLWTGGGMRGRLELEFDVVATDIYEVTAVLTTARDYGVVNLALDKQALCKPIDLFDYPDVRTTGILSFGQRKLATGKHRLLLEIVGSNDSAVKEYLVGLDYVRLTPVSK